MTKSPAVVLLAILLAGCASSDPLPADEQPEPLLAGPTLWPDPQNAPHPAYGWPTLSNPAASSAASRAPPAWWQPFEARDLPDAPSQLAGAARVEGLDTGAGIALFGRLAVVPESRSQVHVVDISDPRQPEVLSSFESGGRGAAIIAYPDGTLVTVLAAGAIEVWDITEPARPALLSTIETQSHKLGVVPGTPIVYNARAGGGGPASQAGPDFASGFTDIYDLSDPRNPAHVQDFGNGYGCHHIFFWNDAAQERYRALCAGFQATQIWDTADPLAPEVISTIPFPHGAVGTPSARASTASFAHTAGLNLAGDVLYVGDESGGGLPPGCYADARMADGSGYSTPVGATWFYDVSDETDPRLLSWYSPLNDPRVNAIDPLAPDPFNAVRSCTAHHGRIIPDADQDLLAMGYYGAGVILIDFTDAAAPRVIDQWTDGTTNVWEVWHAGGYLFTGDQARGMDILEVL